MSNVIFNMQNKDTPTLCANFESVCKRHIQENVKRPHGLSDLHQILIVLDGVGELIFKGKTYPLKKGSAFFIGGNIAHEYTDKGGLVTAYISAKGRGLDELFRYYKIDGFLYFDEVDENKYLSLISSIIAEYFENKRQSVLSSMTYSFFVEFFEEKISEKRTLPEMTVIYLEKNFNKKITLTTLADEFHVSVSKLCHDFKESFGETIFDRILSLRLTYAKNLINTTPTLKTSLIATLSGFEDVSYFCRAYKKAFGSRPSEDKKAICNLQIL